MWKAYFCLRRDEEGTLSSVVDITATFDRKLAAARAHRSQHSEALAGGSGSGPQRSATATGCTWPKGSDG
jgi:LmbE family N-acetylglucosaminyl deacetylase